jgi:hypothetical protein
LKKIALILTLAILLGMAVANAEIRRGTDKFSGGNVIGSYSNISDTVDSIVLFKIVTPTSVEYAISARKSTVKEYAFSKTFLELKVDNEISHKIEVQEVLSLPTDKPFINWNSVKAPVSLEIIDQIKNGKRVALRFQVIGGYSPVVVLPDEVLVEWQQVIATEK